MRDDDPFEAEYRERVERYRDKAERRAERWADWRERWAERRERRAERRTMSWGYTGWYDPMGFWGGSSRGPSELTLRLRDMMKQVDDITSRVSTLERIATGSDARLAAEIERLARGPAASAGRQA